MDQFLTYKKANLGPVFNFTACIYIYIYIHMDGAHPISWADLLQKCYFSPSKKTPKIYSHPKVAVNLFFSFLVFLFSSFSLLFFFCLVFPFLLCFYKSQSLKIAHQLRCAACIYIYIYTHTGCSDRTGISKGLTKRNRLGGGRGGKTLPGWGGPETVFLEGVPRPSLSFCGCSFFAYSWKLPACSGAFLLTVDNFSFFTYSWSFFAYSFSFFTYSWSFFAYSGKVLLIRALRDCKQRSLGVSKKAPTLSKKSFPPFLRPPPFSVLCQRGSERPLQGVSSRALRLSTGFFLRAVARCFPLGQKRHLDLSAPKSRIAVR